MVSWDYDPNPTDPDDDGDYTYRHGDPDVIETPEPYTADEWSEAEGANVCTLDTGCGEAPCVCQQPATAYPTHFERVKDAGYDAGDPKGYSVP